MQTLSPVSRIENGRFISRVLFLAAIFLVPNILASEFYAVIDGGLYTTIHSILEFAGVVVAMSVSLMSWYDYRYKEETGSLILFMAFCAAGIMSFVHTVSYFGMPDFITANSVNKASTFYVLSRLIQAVGILAAVSAGSRRVAIKKAGIIPLAVITTVVVLIVVILENLSFLPPMYDALKGKQTLLKIVLQYTIIAVMLFASAIILKKKEKNSRDFYLVAALLVGIMGDMDFALYSSAYDVFNLLGHLYNVISVGFILKALLERALNEIYQTNLDLEKKGQELAEANWKLRLADQLKNDFLANTNHELRSPLSAIVAFTELLLDQENNGKLTHLQEDYLKEINESSKVLMTRINGLLYLSSVLGGKAILHLEEVTVSQLISEVLERVWPIFEQKGLTLTKNLLWDGTIEVDKDKISRVLTNLLDNAYKFTSPGGVVEVSSGLDAEKGQATISIRDTGIGIEAEQRELIYNLFYQVDSTSTRKYGGTGIGLTLAAKLVEMHGGKIDLESESGIGSRFTVILPISVPRR